MASRESVVFCGEKSDSRVWGDATSTGRWVDQYWLLYV